MMEAVMTREGALIRLMKDHQADVWRFLRLIGCESALADDLTQETFLYIYRNPIEEISHAATSTYLRKAARNLLLNRRRKEGREQPLNVEAAEAAWAALTPSGHGDDRLEALQRCLEKLAERARSARGRARTINVSERAVGACGRAHARAGGRRAADGSGARRRIASDTGRRAQAGGGDDADGVSAAAGCAVP
jgi:hypothetical protein